MAGNHCNYYSFGVLLMAVNTNIDYLGLLALLRRLLALELINDSEAKKIAVRLRVDMGADIAVFL